MIHCPAASLGRTIPEGEQISALRHCGNRWQAAVRPPSSPVPPPLPRHPSRARSSGAWQVRGPPAAVLRARGSTAGQAAAACCSTAASAAAPGGAGGREAAPYETTPLPYNGALLDLRSGAAPPGAPPPGDAEFRRRLKATVAGLRAAGATSCWLQLPIQLAGWAAVAHAEEGFEFHHCGSGGGDGDGDASGGAGGYVVLKVWLREGEDKIPPFATHQVGCAGMVLNDRGELLVIREAHSSGKGGGHGAWKLPGGLLDMGETFEQGACREVWEETGVESEFSSILCFWHRHGLVWGKSDLYVVCLLRPTSSALSPDPAEIDACRWMPLEEFVRLEDHPLILKVCDRLLGRNKATPSEQWADELVPRAQVVRDEVGWPGREPYSTYFPVTYTDQGGEVR